ncbi:MAG: hypothetical protein ACLQVY_06300 [Limisphaerales bacterium]
MPPQFLPKLGQVVRLNFLRRNIAAAADDDLLAPPGKPVVTVGVTARQLTQV